MKRYRVYVEIPIEVEAMSELEAEFEAHQLVYEPLAWNGMVFINAVEEIEEEGEGDAVGQT